MWGYLGFSLLGRTQEGNQKNSLKAIFLIYSCFLLFISV